MKKILSNLVVLASFALAIPGYLTAQNSSRFTSAVTEEASATKPAVEKKADKASVKAMKANMKATNDFNRTFKNAEDAKWSTEKGLIIVSFKKGELRSRSVYNQNGRRLYTILNYYEDGLPIDIRKSVRANYPDLNVTLVQEILENDIQVYKIHLEDATRIKHILIFEGEITEYADFKKSK